MRESQGQGGVRRVLGDDRMNAADLLVAALENEGVEQIFGIPGEENLAMLEALRRSSIRLVVTRHEQAAAFMAAFFHAASSFGCWPSHDTLRISGRVRITNAYESR